MATIVRPHSKTADAPKVLTPTKKRQFFGYFKANMAAKKEASEATKKANALRDDALMPMIKEYGTPYGDKGQHLAIVLDEAVDGKNVVVRQATNKDTVNVDRAEKIATRKGVLDQVQEVSVHLNGIPAYKRDALMQALVTAGLEAFGDVVLLTEFSQERWYAYHQTHRDIITVKDNDRILDKDTTYSLNARSE